ncbi:hypothetical protein BDZ89DRAFT_1066677 [Hymenopellis radicata]|nr:hypothetical protein BDZ89DRAFT_1066677 [Hymenopellis radicata]
MTSRPSRRPSLPAIPDMRFETAYLRKVRPYIHLTRLPTKSREPSDDYDIVYNEEAPKQMEEPRELLTIDWGNVIWATFRDQVLAMWLQGAVWTLISFYLMPVYGRLSERVGRRFSDKEGGAVAYLRAWVHQLGLSTRQY